eukprot:g50796.t1
MAQLFRKQEYCTNWQRHIQAYNLTVSSGDFSLLFSCGVQKDQNSVARDCDRLCRPQRHLRDLKSSVDQPGSE